MPEFRLYHLKDGHISRADELAASDDLEAVKAAKALVDGLPAELWSGKRKIHVFNPAPE